jgi:hypothetical protein
MRNKGSKTSRKGKPTRTPWWILLAVGGLLLFATALNLLSRSGASPNTPIEVIGQPRLMVDQELVDFGEVSYGQTISVTFTLTNTGDQTLQFSEQPYIEVLEGC